MNDFTKILTTKRRALESDRCECERIKLRLLFVAQLPPSKEINVQPVISFGWMKTLE